MRNLTCIGGKTEMSFQDAYQVIIVTFKITWHFQYNNLPFFKSQGCTECVTLWDSFLSLFPKKITFFKRNKKQKKYILLWVFHILYLFTASIIQVLKWIHIFKFLLKFTVQEWMCPTKAIINFISLSFYVL